MAQAGSVATRKLIELLTAPDTGVGPAVANLASQWGVSLAPISPEHIINQNVAIALAERSQAVKYPVMHVYADRVRNLLTEKFRTFSGKVRTLVEIRGEMSSGSFTTRISSWGNLPV